MRLQPIVELQSRKIVSFEALTRWKNSSGDYVPPDTFIEVAEDIGIITEVTDWVVDKVCQTIVEWKKALPDNINMPNIDFNASGKEFAGQSNHWIKHRMGMEDSDYGFSDRIQRILKRNAVEPHEVGIEITEGVFISNKDNATQTLDRLSKEGFKVKLDDFGVGYSSLSYLHELSFDYIKIDRSFVNQVGKKSKAGPLLEGIVELARKLDLKVIAEGIEGIDDYSYLRDIGVDYGQGYFFARPMTIEDAFQLYLENANQAETL